MHNEFRLTDIYSIAPFGQLAETLFRIANQKPLPKTVGPLPKAVKPLIACLYAGAGSAMPDFKIDKQQYPQPAVDGGRVVVSLSGGKDSLAVALVCQEHGYQVDAVHVRGINPAYPHEAKAAKDLADGLKAPFGLISCRVGKQSYQENPAKNQVILLLLAAYAQQQGIGKIAMGLHRMRVAETQPFESGWSDCVEMAKAGAEMIHGIAPCFKVLDLDEFPQSDAQSLTYVAARRPDLLPLVSSCMLPARYKPSTRRANAKKLKYELMPGRCGSCYKCAREWIVLRRLGVVEPAAAYEEHAIRILMKNAVRSFGETAAAWDREKVLLEYLK